MKLTALAGGVGAAKLLSGLSELFAPRNLTIIVNTGDDFRWMGLYVCPDLDTILYTLSGQANPETGWGVAADTFRCLEFLNRLGCDPWFRVGDVDLATHLYRTHRLAEGKTLSAVTEALAQRYGIGSAVLPMSDAHVPTLIHTDEGTLGFQDYFVRRRCSPRVLGFSSERIEAALPSPGVLEAIYGADAIVVCPSNPYLSIGPILAVPGVRAALCATSATIVAVSPIVAGEALKGPAADIMRQLDTPASAVTVARLYADFLDRIVIDRRDASLLSEIEAMGIGAIAVETIMHDRASRVALAGALLRMVS